VGGFAPLGFRRFHDSARFQRPYQSIPRGFGQPHFCTQAQTGPGLFRGPIRAGICQQCDKRPAAWRWGFHQRGELLPKSIPIQHDAVLGHKLEQGCLFLAELDERIALGEKLIELQAGTNRTCV
jgi:hypothetical protein